MNAKRILLQILWFLLLTVLILGVLRLAASITDLFDFSSIDPDGAFAWSFLRHTLQALPFLVLMLVISRFSSIRFGFGWGDRRVGWQYVRIIALIYLGFIIISLLIALITGGYQRFPYPLTARNILGYLGFSLLLTGPSEELIFRAFGMTMLALIVSGPVASKDSGLGRRLVKIFGGEISLANLLAALIFGLAHVRFSFNPFTATYLPGQVLLSVVLGLFYGICYERSGSVYYPMMMHSIVNVATLGVSVLTSLMVG